MHGKRRKRSPIKQDVGPVKTEGLGPREETTEKVEYEQGNPFGIENRIAREKLYEKTEKERQ
tara:strand:- start:207 stop:392 length:186 start_codon:yes stop_codon:yes gene_type:complete